MNRHRADIDYDRLHDIWRRAHVAGSPVRFVRQQVVAAALNHLKTGTVLEVGCGNGENAVQLARQGHRVTAIDPSAAAIAALRRQADGLRGMDARVAGIEDIEAPQAFDHVVTIEVMEHMADDRDFARRLAVLLKPGGTLVLSVPAGPFLYSTADRMSGHYRRYSRRSLTAVLNDAGFSGIRIRHYGFPLLLVYTLLRKLLLDKMLTRHLRRRPAAAGPLALTRFYPLVLWADRYGIPGVSVGMVANCRKV